MKKWFSKFRNKRIYKSRKVTRATFFYRYVIFGAMAGLGYLMVALIWDLPLHWSFTPLYLLIGFVIGRFFVKNGKMMLLYLRDMEQGKLLLFLNDHTHWQNEHKMKVINWVYLRRKTIRQETHAATSKMIMDGEGITEEERQAFAYSVVHCPQQIKLGFNEALLINALIYAHNNIQVLDDELRGIMDLTDEHLLAFDLKKEYDKAGGLEFQKYMEIGERNSKNLN